MALEQGRDARTSARRSTIRPLILDFARLAGRLGVHERK
jgi:hypothetical protein